MIPQLLTPGGKLDLRALPALPATVRREGAHEALRPGRGETVAAAWRAVLATENVGRPDDFLERGGSSSHSIRVVERGGGTLAGA